MLDINSTLPAPQSTPLSSGKGSEAVVVLKNSDVQAVPVRVASVGQKETGVSDDERQANLRAAASTYNADGFAVSDKTFTIFKNSAGQYITRYVSLRDGSVTYIPEVNILQNTSTGGTKRESFVEIQA